MANLSGSVLVQRFRLDALQRQDDLGDHYRGLDLKRNLALNVLVLRSELAYDPTLFSFHQGQLTLQTLAHAHVVPFYGLYQDRDISFMVEKQVEGQLLSEVLSQRGGQPLPLEEAVIYLKALGAAVGYAHGFGLIHCNIKPAHVIIENNGNILLAGFGFARSADSPMTASGIAGLPAYMAPEAIQKQAVTPATDIYSLGILLYELVVGRHPFLQPGESLQSPGVAGRLSEAHLRQPPPDPRLANPSAPAGLAQVIATALSKSPRDRYQSAQEMVEVACAVLGKSPDELPDRLGMGAAGAAVLVARHASPASPPSYATTPFYQQGEPPSTPRPVPPTQVAPQPPYTPATQVAPQPPYTAYPPAGPTQAAPSQRLAQKQKGLPWLWIIIVCMVLFMCVVSAALAGFWLLGGLATATPTPTPTFTATATQQPPALPPTGAPPVLPPTQPGGQLLTDTPTPTSTPFPTPTPPPTATPRPTNTPMPSSFTVTIRNNLGYPILAYRDGQMMGTDPIPPGMYIYYKGIPPGRHTFTMCHYEFSNQCPTEKTVEVYSDMTITAP
jgi:serine/threonine-protein kinase